MRRRRRSVLAWGLAVGLAVLCLYTLVGTGLPHLPAPTRAHDRASEVEVETESPNLPAQRTAIEAGRVVVRLTPEERERIGVETALLRPSEHRIELQAYGSVLDLARVTELTNAYATAKAQLQTAEARAEVSRSAFQRAKSLGQYATQVQIETAEGTFQTDQAALAAAQSQVRTLAATAQQEWGPVIGRAIVERSPAVTRLIERTDFLMQVTLPPGETLRGRPGAAAAEVPPQSARVALRYVSPATRTDQRVQGLSFFYLAAGDSGLLPGMSTLVFIPSDRSATGVAVPEDCVVHWQGGAWIYRGVGKGVYARHALRSDPPMADDAYVVEDLGGETEVVLRGAQALLSEEVRGQFPASGDADDD